MAEIPQGDLYYQALVANEGIDEEPEEIPGGVPEVRSEEYKEMDYEAGKYDKESDEEESIRGIPSKPHPSKAIPDQHIVWKSSTDRLRSLEEEVANLKQQLFAAKVRAVRVEYNEDEITREMSELAEILVHHFNI